MPGLVLPLSWINPHRGLTPHALDVLIVRDDDEGLDLHEYLQETREIPVAEFKRLFPQGLRFIQVLTDVFREHILQKRVKEARLQPPEHFRLVHSPDDGYRVEPVASAPELPLET